MLYLLILFIVICIIGIKFCDNSSDYLSKNQTQAIKGFFAMIIFFSHFNQYAIFDSSVTNNIYLFVIKKIGQLMVTMYLFYSGYGIIKSIETKKNYIKNFPKKRILKVLISFDCAILLYLIVNMILKNKYSLKTILLSFIGWESIGNSNWYIFVLLVLYLIIYITGLVFKNKIDLKFIIANILFDIILIIALYFTKNDYWYNIILTFPLGLLYGMFEEKIEKIIKEHYIAILAMITLCFIGTYISNSFIMYEFKAIFFSLLIVLLSYKIKINNRVLEKLGKYSFEMYILQRLFYIIYEKAHINYILFFTISLISTLVLSILFQKATYLITKNLRGK